MVLPACFLYPHGSVEASENRGRSTNFYVAKIEEVWQYCRFSFVKGRIFSGHFTKYFQKLYTSLAGFPICAIIGKVMNRKRSIVRFCIRIGSGYPAAPACSLGRNTIVKKTYEMDMCSGPLFRKILSFALPLMRSGILQLLFNAADIIVVGRYTGSTALAAVGSTTSLINLLVNLFIGMSVGANVIIARSYGAGDADGVHKGCILLYCVGCFRCGDDLYRHFAVASYVGIDRNPGGCHRSGGAVHAHLFLRYARIAAVQFWRGNPARNRGYQTPALFFADCRGNQCRL